MPQGAFPADRRASQPSTNLKAKLKSQPPASKSQAPASQTLSSKPKSPAVATRSPEQRIAALQEKLQVHAIPREPTRIPVPKIRVRPMTRLHFCAVCDRDISRCRIVVGGLWRQGRTTAGVMDEAATGNGPGQPACHGAMHPWASPGQPLPTPLPFLSQPRPHTQASVSTNPQPERRAMWNCLTYGPESTLHGRHLGKMPRAAAPPD